MADGPAALTLPPPYRETRLVGRDPLAEARARAAALGAGALLWAERPGVLAMAVVLEPECPLAEARLAHYAGMSALAEAVAGVAAPERAVTIDWPDTLVYDGARLGGGTLEAPEGAEEDAVPDWLVFAAELIADRDDASAPGSTSLAEEAIGPVPALVEGFAAHLLRNFDTWSALGFEALAARFRERLAPGGTRRIGADGALAVETEAGVVVRRGLSQALAERRWHDPARGGPRL